MEINGLYRLEDLLLVRGHEFIAVEVQDTSAKDIA